VDEAASEAVTRSDVEISPTSDVSRVLEQAEERSLPVHVAAVEGAASLDKPAHQ